jgi:DNA-binding PucR family transcriptional regulator
VATSNPRELADVLRRAGAPAAAVGAPVGELARLADSLRQARTAAWAARADRQRFGAVVAYADLGGWATVVELWLDAGRPAPPACVEVLARHRAGEELLAAAEAVLERPGSDMAAVAERLHVHRGTLYRRIERIEELTGLDLGDGDDRLALHLGLRLRRLALA